MKIATWNVNSVRARLPRVLEWLDHYHPDVACLQEIKVVDDDFPVAEFEARGYRCLVNGQKTYNGVAILSRHEAVDVIRTLPGDAADADARFLAATIAGIRVVNLYVYNGRDVGHPMYATKLEWFARLRTWLDTLPSPDEPVLLCGDFNVAPDDRDVWDPEQWRDRILFSEPEKAAFHQLLDWGLEDAFRRLEVEGGHYTWWDYRGGAFRRGWGLRIDHILVSRPLAERCLAVDIHRDLRKGEKPSDHAPVMATFNLIEGVS